MCDPSEPLAASGDAGPGQRGPDSAAAAPCAAAPPPPGAWPQAAPGPGGGAARRGSLRLSCEVAIAAPVIAAALYLECCQLQQLGAASRAAAARAARPGSAAPPTCWTAPVSGSCFSVLLSTWRRPGSARAAVSHYRRCPHVAEVRVIWAESPAAPHELGGSGQRGAPVAVEAHWPETSLNTRFVTQRPLLTDSVFSVDDDVRVSCRDLARAFSLWRRSPASGTVAGFFPRVAQRAGPAEWRYRGFPAVIAWHQYSIVLTKAAFLPTRLLADYNADAPAAARSRALVSAKRNCEDIAMMFVAANVTGGVPPLFVSPEDEVIDYGSWLFGRFVSGVSSSQALGRHMLDRGKCLSELARIWGRPDAASPLPVAAVPAAGSPWRAANGWEYVSSDLWAPLSELSAQTVAYWGLVCFATAAASAAAYFWTGRLLRALPMERCRCARRIAALVAAALAMELAVVPVIPEAWGWAGRRLSDARAGLAGALPVLRDHAGCPAQHLRHGAEYDFRVPTRRAPSDERRYRIAVVSGNYAGVVDGVSLTLNRMVEFLEREGHIVRVFAPGGNVGIKHHAGELIDIHGVSGWVLGRPEYLYATHLDGTALSRMAAFAPHIVHIATPDGAGRDAQAWARTAGVPVVCSYHTRFNAYLAYYGAGVLEGLYWQVVGGFFNQCHRLLPPTAAISRELRAAGIKAQQRIWPRGVETHHFSPAQRCTLWRENVMRQRLSMGPLPDSHTVACSKGGCGSFLGPAQGGGSPTAAAGARRRLEWLRDSTVILLLACRLVLEKGTEVFAAVIERLEHVGVPHVTVVAGDGPAREQLMARLPRAIFLGEERGAGLLTAYASSDLFFYPSLTETWGNVVLEAMASGLPVVGANASGTGELVHDGEEGFLVDPNAPAAGLAAAYSDRIARLVRDVPLRQRMGAAARQRALGLTWPAAFRRLAAVYDEVAQPTLSPAM
eukprot:TRINITY_DN21899_c0_g1_i1.p1 TRINITY_DN21899_c0_g1~~TRINITY_DN21899_c0_g1_i1.p1  ORF type:complete len:975 (+),score=226.04 TRINITY_DN21899_c0_g1_i1:67-2925(+)